MVHTVRRTIVIPQLLFNGYRRSLLCRSYRSFPVVAQRQSPWSKLFV